MKQIKLFLQELFKEIIKDDVVSLANELTYKLLLALFPFIIFLMSIIGFFNINGEFLIYSLQSSLPKEVMEIIEVFVDEVVVKKSPSILSSSLLISIISSASGFRAIIRGINKAYGNQENRGFIKLHLISFLLVIIFAFAIILSMLSILFGDNILKLIYRYTTLAPSFVSIYNFMRYIISILILLFTIMIIYKLASCKRLTLLNVLPGAIITVTLWVLASKFFNIYLQNFSKYSKVYGSIGSVFILIFWINIISITLLVGSEVNAILEVN